MPRYTEEFEVVRQDAYMEGLDLLAEVERKATLDTVSWVPTNRNMAVARGGVAQRLFDAGFTDADIKSLVGPWMTTWVATNVAIARNRLQVKPQLAVTKNLIRDSQQGKLYKAEGRIPSGEQLGPIQIERYVGEILADRWFAQYHPELEISDLKFKFPTKGARASCKTQGQVHTLRFPNNHRTRRHVVHEVAHAAAHAKWGADRIAGHGAEYAYVFLRLMYHRFGRAVGFALQNAYIDCKVQTSPRLKPLAQVTDEERAKELAPSGY